MWIGHHRASDAQCNYNVHLRVGIGDAICAPSRFRASVLAARCHIGVENTDDPRDAMELSPLTCGGVGPSTIASRGSSVFSTPMWHRAARTLARKREGAQIASPIPTRRCTL